MRIVRIPSVYDVVHAYNAHRACRRVSQLDRHNYIATRRGAPQIIAYHYLQQSRIYASRAHHFCRRVSARYSRRFTINAFPACGITKRPSGERPLVASA